MMVWSIEKLLVGQNMKNKNKDKDLKKYKRNPTTH